MPYYVRWHSITILIAGMGIYARMLWHKYVSCVHIVGCHSVMWRVCLSFVIGYAEIFVSCDIFPILTSTHECYVGKVLSPINTYMNNCCMMLWVTATSYKHSATIKEFPEICAIVLWNKCTTIIGLKQQINLPITREKYSTYVYKCLHLLLLPISLLFCVANYTG